MPGRRRISAEKPAGSACANLAPCSRRALGVKHCLWRAVDQNVIVLFILVLGRHDTRSAKRLLCKLMKPQCRTPRVMITDKLASYGAAKREVMPSVEHRTHKGLNDRVETSHQHTRRRERQINRFKSFEQAQRFLCADDVISRSPSSAVIKFLPPSIEPPGSKLYRFRQRLPVS